MPIVVGVAVALVAITAWIGIRGFLAKGELEAAVPLAGVVQSELIAGDAAAAQKTFASLDQHASAAASLTSDPIWRFGEIVPFVGPNLTVVRELASVVNQVSGQAIKPLVSAAGHLDVGSFKPVDGTIQLQPLMDAAPDISAAAEALASANDRVVAIDASASIPLLQAAAVQLQDAVLEANEVALSVDRAVQLLPAMLGADGARNYLVLFQNPAELRSGGGIPGALALVHTDGGRIDLVQQASSTDFPAFEAPVLDVPTDTRGIYGDTIGQYIQNVTLTPRFPITADLAREMWKRQFGVDVDGVLSADPVMLAYLLEATGPVDVGAGEQLTSENAVRVLLSDVYARYTVPSDQDAFFAAAAAAVFSKLSSGQLDAPKLISAVTRAGAEGRALIWSARPEEQTLLAGTTLAGELPVSDSDTQHFGVYLNDGTGSKMDYYLTPELKVGQAVCRNDGLVTIATQLTLTSTAPADAATSLPGYVTGAGAFGVPPGIIRTVVRIYGPPGSVNLGATSPAEGFAMYLAEDDTYPVTIFTIDLAPGESVTATTTMLAPARFAGEVAAVITPGINTPETSQMLMTC
ncbi:DUF4012 domain-containing protein [Salinibacterium sp. G-O1]|uniref:DUF4012 domain-containing protein n=1 Tax=Salinibacterium sp. G-O1 TaxID=3046208 RepID=UPI0024B9B65B|nr:DUF4012 domain-containing protein [Salinibacterium sp. G-O1]MDJ0336171.1 DUF4012 domain-containing protein [Salinibacterium sp. G-O1]